MSPEIVPGQVWRWTVQLQAPDGLLNPGGFDAERWMFERGLRAQGRVVTRQVPAPLLVRQASLGAPGLIDRMRLVLRDRIEAHVPDPQVAGLIAGLTIGEQSAIWSRPIKSAPNSLLFPSGWPLSRSRSSNKVGSKVWFEYRGPSNKVDANTSRGRAKPRYLILARIAAMFHTSKMAGRSNAPKQVFVELLPALRHVDA